MAQKKYNFAAKGAPSYGREYYEDHRERLAQGQRSQMPGAWADYHHSMMDRRMMVDPYYEHSLRAQYRRRILHERTYGQQQFSQPNYESKSQWIQNRKNQPKEVDEESVKDSFDEIMKEIEESHGRENLRFPSRILLLIGPPGAGKTTVGKCFQKKLDYNMMISLRNMCQHVMQKNQGARFNIQPVTKMMLTKVFTCPKDDNVRLIIDDFSSISIARIIPFMVDYAEGLRKEFPDLDLPAFKLKICALTCHKDACVDRKLKEKMTGNYKSYSTLYKKFNKRSAQVKSFLSKFYKFEEVNASDNLENVQIRAIIEIEKEKNGACAKN
jgi:adenylate kinase family enzyme